VQVGSGLPDFPEEGERFGSIDTRIHKVIG
jgi:hypothetical protein